LKNPYIYFIINFCSNDYLSLAKHPKIKQAFKQGVDKFGVGAGASHVLAGLRLGLKNRQVGEKWVSDDCSYLCKDLL
jgi:hypothetical protein